MSLRRIAQILVMAAVTCAAGGVQAQQEQEDTCPEAPGYRGVALLGEQRSSGTGWVTYRLGDINGDGYEDFAIVAPSYSYHGRSFAGLFYVIYGNPEQSDIALASIGPDTPPAPGTGFTIVGARGGQTPIYLRGGLMSAVGDLDGDGYGDFVLGDSAGYLVPGQPVGAVYVFYGGQDFPSVVDLREVPAGAYGDRIVSQWGNTQGGWGLGLQVSGIGDINGDGLDDFAIPLGQDSGGYVVHIYFGQHGRLDSFSPAIVLRASVQYGIGYGLIGGFDYDGDGTDDFMVCDSYLQTIYGDPPGGMCYLLWGATLASLAPEFDLRNLLPEQGGDGSLGIVLVGGENTARIGLEGRVAVADLNGDGLDDLIFGAPDVRNGNGEVQTGRVYVLYGSRNRSFVSLMLADLANAPPGPDQLGFVLEPELPPYPVRFGQGVAAAGDANGDGIDDLLIGEPQHRFEGNPQQNCGTTWLIYGRRQSDGGFPPLLVVGDGTINQGIGLNLSPGAGCSAQQFGTSVVSLPDFTGDGKPEWLIGAPAAFVDDGVRGKACLHLSSEPMFPAGVPVVASVDAGSYRLWAWLGLGVLLMGMVAARRRY
jgi:hypothetical protein